MCWKYNSTNYEVIFSSHRRRELLIAKEKTANKIYFQENFALTNKLEKQL